jgi:hypothetical protein
LKSIDGASHEFYQLSHKHTIEGSVGRVKQSAGRVGCCVDSLLGCELLDWVDRMSDVGAGAGVGAGENSTRHVERPDKEQVKDDVDDQDMMDLNDRKLVLDVNLEEPLHLCVVVLYEPFYNNNNSLNRFIGDIKLCRTRLYTRLPQRNGIALRRTSVYIQNCIWA